MRESTLLLVRAVIQVYVRPAMFLNNSYAKNVLRGPAGVEEAMECSVDGDEKCAVLINAESDIAMTGTSSSATATGCESVLEGSEERTGYPGSSSIIEDMRGDSREHSTAHTTEHRGGRSREHRGGLIKHLVMSLVFLQARCPGEADVVPDVAIRSCHYTIRLLYLHVQYTVILCQLHLHILLYFTSVHLTLLHLTTFHLHLVPPVLFLPLIGSWMC